MITESAKNTATTVTVTISSRVLPRLLPTLSKHLRPPLAVHLRRLRQCQLTSRFPQRSRSTTTKAMTTCIDTGARGSQSRASAS